MSGIEIPSCSSATQDSTSEDSASAVIGTSGMEVKLVAEPLSTLATPPVVAGERKVLAVLVSFSDSPNVYTKANVQDVYFNITNKHVSYVFPKNACSWAGLGNVPGSKTWVNGYLDLKVVGHELGHNLGLFHANALSCGSSSIGSECTILNYGDPTDAMGNKSTGHFTAFQKARLGWLGETKQRIETITSSGVFDLTPYEDSLDGLKAIKIPYAKDSNGKQTYYFVEHRTSVGFDSVLGKNGYNLANQGVVVHSGSDATGNSSNILHMNPGQSWGLAGLNVGQLFNDSQSGISIQLLSADSKNASVSVVIGNSPAILVDVSADKTDYARGNNIRITLQAKSSAGTAAGYEYAVEIRDPIGNALSMKGTLDSTGKAILEVAVGTCAPEGQYDLTASLRQGSSSVATDQLSFHVGS